MTDRHAASVQAIFDYLAGEDSPLAKLDPGYVAFCAELITTEVEDHASRIRWRTGRTTPDDERDDLFEYETNAQGVTTVGVRPEWRQIIAMRAAAPVERRGRGRPKTSPDRYRLIAQVFNVYPKGTATLKREWGSHFESAVNLALRLAGDSISDVYAEIRAAKAMPGWPDPGAH